MTAAMIISGTVGWFVLAAGVSPRAGCSGAACSARWPCWPSAAGWGNCGGPAEPPPGWPVRAGRRGAGAELDAAVRRLRPRIHLGRHHRSSHAALHAGRAGRIVLQGETGRAQARLPGAGLRRPGGHRRGRPAAALHAGGSFATGVALALGAAFFYAIAAIIAKGLKGVPPHLIVLIQLLIGAALMSPSAALPDQPRAWGLLVAIGVVHTGLMSTLLYSALQRPRPASSACCPSSTPSSRCW